MPADEQEAPAGRLELPVGQPAEAVSVPVAARRLGRSPDAIRSAIRRGKLSGRVGNNGKWLVFLPAGAAGASDVDQPETGALRRSTDSQQLEIDRLRAELEQERRLSADRMAAADDRLATIAELRERVGRLEGEAAGHAALVDELRASLAWARLPWWRKLFGP